MVTINFTIVVQLVLFLLFLWVTNRLVLQPILRVKDERDRRHREDRGAAEADTAEAEKLEADYAAKLAAARREGVVRVEQARREALHERLEALNAHKQESEAQVKATREEAANQIEAARAAYVRLAPGLAEDIAQKLHIHHNGPKGSDS